jgi:hypothetical protein
MNVSRILAAALAITLSACNVSISTTPPEKLPPATAGTAERQAEVFEVAKAIVHRLDRGRFDEVWDASSRMLKDATFKPAFAALMSATRGKLGKPDPRGAPRIGFAKKVDVDGPEGDYAIVEVDTTFSGKVVTEKVVLAREGEQWKLAGYFMRTSTPSVTGQAGGS